MQNISINIYHPLDQFEMIVLWFYWSGIVMPVGFAIWSHLTDLCVLNVFLFYICFTFVFNCAQFNVWAFFVFLFKKTHAPNW